MSGFIGTAPEFKTKRGSRYKLSKDKDYQRKLNKFKESNRK